MNIYKTLLILFLMQLIFVSETNAHRVNIFAWVEGDTVYTESKFSSGKKAQKAIIEVFDDKGKKLLQGKTDSQGRFSFKLTKKKNLKIVLTAGMGHKNYWIINAEEIGSINQSIKQPDLNIPIQNSDNINEHTSSVKNIENTIKPLINQLNNLQKEYQKIKIRDIIGGIGYILGLFGIAGFFYSRKKK